MLHEREFQRVPRRAAPGDWALTKTLALTRTPRRARRRQRTVSSWISA